MCTATPTGQNLGGKEKPQWPICSTVPLGSRDKCLGRGARAADISLLTVLEAECVSGCTCQGAQGTGGFLLNSTRPTFEGLLATRGKDVVSVELILICCKNLTHFPFVHFETESL